MRYRRKTLKTSEIAKRRRRLFFLKIGLYIFILVLFVAGIGVVSGSKALTIQEVEIQGGIAAYTPSITALAQSALSGKYFYLLSKRNIFLYPSEKIKHEILDQYEGISEVELNLTEFHTLEITLRKYTPAYLWCGEKMDSPKTSRSDEILSDRVGTTTDAVDTPLVQPEQDCYYLDISGLVFSHAPTSSREKKYVDFYGPLLKTRDEANSNSVLLEATDTSDTLSRVPQEQSTTTAQYTLQAKNPLGHYFLEAKTLENVIAILDNLDKMGMSVRFLVWNTNGEITIGTNQSWELKLKADENPLDVEKNLKTFLHSDPFKGEGGKQKLNALTYIDLRFGNKIYYK